MQSQEPPSRRTVACLCSGNVRHSIAFRQCTTLYCFPAMYGSLYNSGKVRQSIAFRQCTTVYCIPATYGSLVHSGNVRQSTAVRQRTPVYCTAACLCCGNVCGNASVATDYCTAATYGSLLHCGNVRQSVALRQACVAATHDNLLYFGMPVLRQRTTVYCIAECPLLQL